VLPPLLLLLLLSLLLLPLSAGHAGAHSRNLSVFGGGASRARLALTTGKSAPPPPNLRTTAARVPPSRSSIDAAGSSKRGVRARRERGIGASRGRADGADGLERLLSAGRTDFRLGLLLFFRGGRIGRVRLFARHAGHTREDPPPARIADGTRGSCISR